MDTEKAFTSYQGMETHLVKLRVTRDVHVLRFENHWRALGEPQVRATLLKGAVRDMVDDIEPVKRLKELFTGGGIVSQLAMGMITRRGGFMRRFLTSAVAMAAPALLQKVPWHKVMGNLRGEAHILEDHEMNGH